VSADRRSRRGRAASASLRASRLIGVLACALVSFALLPGGAARAQEPGSDPHHRLLRLGIFAPQRHIHVQEALIPWMENVNSTLRKDGFEIELFSGGALGRKGEFQLRLLRTGIHDLNWFPTGYVPGRFPGAELLEIPLLTDDPRALTRAFWRLYDRGALPGFSDLKALALSVSPAYHFHLTFPVDSLDDLAGRKIRVLNAAQAEMMRVLGATPVAGIGGSEVAESLSRGLIDGALFSWHATRSMGIELITTTHINQPIAFSPSVVVIRQETFDSLPPRSRAAIEAASGEAFSMAYIESMQSHADAAVERVKADPRHTIYTPTPAEQERFRRAFQRVVERWAGGDPERERLIDRLDAVLQEIQAERADGELDG